MTDEEKGKKLLELVKKFIEDQEIYCPETVYQTDHVIQNSYEFVESLCNVVGYLE